MNYCHLTTTALLTLSLSGCSLSPTHEQLDEQLDFTNQSTFILENVVKKNESNLNVKELLKLDSFNSGEENTIQLATFITMDDQLCTQYVREISLVLTSHGSKVSNVLDVYCEPIESTGDQPKFKHLAYMEDLEINGLFIQFPVLTEDDDLF